MEISAKTHSLLLTWRCFLVLFNFYCQLMKCPKNCQLQKDIEKIIRLFLPFSIYINSWNERRYIWFFWLQTWVEKSTTEIVIFFRFMPFVNTFLWQPEGNQNAETSTAESHKLPSKQTKRSGNRHSCVVCSNGSTTALGFTEAQNRNRVEDVEFKSNQIITCVKPWCHVSFIQILKTKNFSNFHQCIFHCLKASFFEK